MEITRDSTQKEYVAKNNPGVRDCDYIHKCGQRKLLISEIDFLTKYSNLSETVVYIGAAPGNHINLLISLFPEIKCWILYDPLAIRVFHPKVQIHNTLMTIEEAEKYDGKNCLLISDIRSYERNQGKVPPDVANKTIIKDMKLQKEIVRAGGFIMSSLKFRLPWDNGDTLYYKGKLYTTPWLGEYSPELRLYTDGQSIHTYHNKAIDNQMYYYNTVNRRCKYQNIFENHHMEHDYLDQLLELNIVENYLITICDVEPEDAEEEAISFIKKYCDVIKASPEH